MAEANAEGVELERLQYLRSLQAQVADFDRQDAEQRRAELLERCPHPLALAVYLQPKSLVSTPAMELVSTTWANTLNTPNGRQVTSMCPQHGKTILARFSAFWALLQDPHRRIVFASYAMGLAVPSVRAIRELVVAYGEPYGLTLNPNVRTADYWELQTAPGLTPGSCKAASPDSQLTGSPADCVWLDDLLHGEQAALSQAERTRVETWWESTVRVRMAPQVPIIAIGTRWSRGDILSRFIEEGWPRINIPAVADGRTLDSVADVPGARQAGGYLVSARGHTPEDYQLLRKESGERAFYALYQGAPTPPAGNIFLQEWFDNARVERAELPDLVEIAVGVDPADTGTGDEAGIVVAGRAADGHLYLLADYSGMLSQAQWARRVCLAWLEQNAAKVVQEKSLGMRSSIPDAWSLIRRQASALVRNDHNVRDALADLYRAGDGMAADEAQLAELLPSAVAILERVSSGPRVESVTPRQSKLVRAQSVTGLFETARAHIVGKLPELELELTTWTPSSRYSPARVDTVAHLLTRLDTSNVSMRVASPAGGGSGSSSAPQRLPRRSGAARDHGLAVIPGGLPTRAGAAGGLPSRAGAGPRRGGFRPAG